MDIYPKSTESSRPPLVDKFEVRRTFLALAQAGQVIELRILSAIMAASPHFPYQASGYFNNADALIDALKGLRSAKGVYITLHPCNPMLLSRAYNRLRTAEEMRKEAATSDRDIARLRWLLIDLDPERPADISSSGLEHHLARNHAITIKKELEELGWPDPLQADSGNGAHLLYRVDLPIEEGAKGTGLIHRVLKGLARRFDLSWERQDEEPLRLLVDQTVFNPSRICKLYGTLACKGDNTEERPHRLARLLKTPYDPQITTRELLEAIAEPLPGPSRHHPTRPPVHSRTAEKIGGASVKHSFDLEAWIDENQLNVSEPVDWPDGRKWLFRVCPWNEEHTDRSAFIVQHTDGSIDAGCHHNSCQDHNWQSLRALYKPEDSQRQSGPPGPARRGTATSSEQYHTSSSTATNAPDLTELEEALKTHDLARCLESVPALAQLDRLLYTPQKQRIKETFGKEINLRHLDSAVAKARKEAGNEGGQKNQTEILVSMAEQHATLFTDPGGVCYARVPVREHEETHPVQEHGGLFKHWLMWYYHTTYDDIPNEAALTSATQTLIARATFEQPECQQVFIRVGWSEGRVYLDLANSEHQVVEITPLGWHVLPLSPVCFRRYRGMHELPQPTRGGTLASLDPFLNADAETRLLAKAWLIGCFHSQGPYPVLALHGERGAAKTTTARVLRSLVDPCVALLRSAPKDIQALAVAAANNHIIGLDNLSSMPTWLSDALCRTATGAGDAYRQLYTDSNEVIFNYTRPIIFTGIEEIGTRGDFLDRCLLLHLPAIADQERQTEKAFWSAFEVVHPLILGALLDAVSLALHNYRQTELSQKPRMADFATWVSACEPALLSPDQAAGTFLSIYQDNREEAIELDIEASQIGSVLVQFMEQLAQPEWRGTVQELLDILNERTDERNRSGKSWPADVRALGSRLKRLATSLRSMGIATTWKRTKGKRQIILQKTAAQSSLQGTSNPDFTANPGFVANPGFTATEDIVYENLTIEDIVYGDSEDMDYEEFDL